MAVLRCTHCRRTFWQFPGRAKVSFLPNGYCTWPCFEARRKRRSRPGPDSPASIRLLIAAHRKIAHDGQPWMIFYDNCAGCERLEEKLLNSLAEVV